MAKKFEGSKSIYDFAAYREARKWRDERDRLRERVAELEAEIAELKRKRAQF